MKTIKEKIISGAFLGALILGTSPLAQAQWATSGTPLILSNATPSVQGASSTNGALLVSTPNGTIQLGPVNTAGWCHIDSDQPRFYFNKGIFTANGVFSSYNGTDLSLQTGTGATGVTRMTVNNGSGYVGINTTTPGAPLDLNMATSSGLTGIFRNGSYLTQLFTKSCGACYNNMVQNNDNGIIFTDALGSSDLASGFVIAPWQNTYNGLRLDGQTGNLALAQNLMSLGSASYSSMGYGTSYMGFNVGRGSSGSWTCSSDGVHNGASGFYGDIFGNTHLFNIAPSASSPGTPQILSDASLVGSSVMTLTPGGKVIIGSPALNITTPGTYNLYVAGGILTEKVRVAIVNGTSWADYVFAKDYKLVHVM
jgi:hypothetical protein